MFPMFKVAPGLPGLWRKYPRRHRENMQTSHSKKTLGPFMTQLHWIFESHWIFMSGSLWTSSADTQTHSETWKTACANAAAAMWQRWRSSPAVYSPKDADLYQSWPAPCPSFLPTTELWSACWCSSKGSRTRARERCSVCLTLSR